MKPDYSSSSFSLKSRGVSQFAIGTTSHIEVVAEDPEEEDRFKISSMTEHNPSLRKWNDEDGKSFTVSPVTVSASANSPPLSYYKINPGVIE